MSSELLISNISIDWSHLRNNLKLSNDPNLGDTIMFSNQATFFKLIPGFHLRPNVHEWVIHTRSPNIWQTYGSYGNVSSANDDIICAKNLRFSE